MTLAPNFDDFSKEEIIQTLDEIRHPIEVAIYGSENHFNFGSIIRSCHNFLVRKIYAIDLEKFYKKAAVTALKWEKKNIQHFSLKESVEYFNDKNLVAFERRSTLDSEDIRGFIYPQNPILLFGSENFGVPDELLNISKFVVSIPGFGFVNDLNLATAASIALYDWIKKYYANSI